MRRTWFKNTQTSHQNQKENERTKRKQIQSSFSKEREETQEHRQQHNTKQRGTNNTKCKPEWVWTAHRSERSSSAWRPAWSQEQDAAPPFRCLPAPARKSSACPSALESAPSLSCSNRKAVIVHCVRVCEERRREKSEREWEKDIHKTKKSILTVKNPIHFHSTKWKVNEHQRQKKTEKREERRDETDCAPLYSKVMSRNTSLSAFTFIA